MITEIDLRKAYASSAKMWLGANTGSVMHQQIIDTYNSIDPLPRGYKVKYTDAWCATFVSAVAKNNCLDKIFPFECSCYYMMQKLIKTNQWIEDDTFIPSIGDLIFYDWKDSSNYQTTDNIGVPGHVGIITDTSSKGVFVIEGNKSSTVGTRTVAYNGRYIRGFGHLDFASLVSDVELDWAKNVGLFHGDENGNFHWDDPISRSEIARVMYRWNNYMAGGKNG